MDRYNPPQTARDILRLEDYERFYHTKRYLQSLAPGDGDADSGMGTVSANDAPVPDAANLLRISMVSGCGSISEFLEKKKAWDTLQKKIPLDYLEYLEIDWSLVTHSLELDGEEYRTALKIPRYPKTVFIRLLEEVFISEPLPGGLSEKEALAFIQYNIGENHLYHCINYPELLTIFIEPDGRAVTAYYPPEIVFTRKYAEPKPDGRELTGSSLHTI